MKQGGDAMRHFKSTYLPIMQNLPIYIVDIGGSDFQKVAERPAGSASWHLFYTLQGKGEMIVKGSKQTLTAGNLMILRAGEPHKYYPLCEKWETRWILFSGKEIDSLMETLGITASTLVSVYDAAFLEKRFYELYDVCKQNFEPVTVSYLLYALICQVSLWKKEQSMQPLCDIICKATRYIQFHFDEPITLADLTEYTKVSGQYLCRLFQKYYSMRPFAYINKMRLEKAQNLLMEGKLSVSEIARQCCFESSSYFAKKFKEQFGVSPSQFMKYYRE